MKLLFMWTTNMSNKTASDFESLHSFLLNLDPCNNFSF